MVCNAPVSCKANGVGNQLGAWRYSDLIVVLYMKKKKLGQIHVVGQSLLNLLTMIRGFLVSH